MVGFPPKHPKCWSFLVGKPMGLLGKPTILGNPHNFGFPAVGSGVFFFFGQSQLIKGNFWGLPKEALEVWEWYEKLMGRGSQYWGVCWVKLQWQFQEVFVMEGQCSSKRHVVYPKVNSAKFGVPPVTRFTLLSRGSFPFACGTGLYFFCKVFCIPNGGIEW